MSRLRTFSRRFLLYPLILGAGALTIDDHFNSNRVQRNMRAFYTALRIMYEYKMNWSSEKTFRENEEVHRRAAKLILNCCQKNGGLYVKFGQGIASMNHILPRPFREEFECLHDKAPSVPYSDVRRMIIEDLKVDPNVIFSEFDEVPVASASIAQVHRARLHSGETVAVKVQKPYIADQVPWDLACYRILLHGFEYAFDLPLCWSTDFTVRQMMTEIDFVSEAMNSQKTKQLLLHQHTVFDYPNKLQRRTLKHQAEDQPDGGGGGRPFYDEYWVKDEHLKERVYVPKLYPSYCSQRIMTAEWCDGVKVNDLEAIRKMGYSFSDIMHSVVSLFGHQIFVTGVVHCDPHPGNVLVRRRRNGEGSASWWWPWSRNQYELVLLDHGLYIEEPADFRKQYCQFWTAMFLRDFETLNAIGSEWGVSDIDFFASLQLIKPFSSKKGVIDTKTLSRKDIIRMQLDAKKRVQRVLAHTRTIPRHLIFVGRNMNIVRANNKDLGSAVNRVGILAEYAAKGASLVEERGRSYYWQYRLNMFGIGLYYSWKTHWKAFNEMLWGEDSTVTSFEDDIENQMKQFAKDMGLIVEQADEAMFDA